VSSGPSWKSRTGRETSGGAGEPRVESDLVEDGHELQRRGGTVLDLDTVDPGIVLHISIRMLCPPHCEEAV
jgi:hypothetical protein